VPSAGWGVPLVLLGHCPLLSGNMSKVDERPENTEDKAES